MLKVKNIQSLKLTKPQRVFSYPSHGQKMHKITVCQFDLVTLTLRWRFRQIFVAFSEYINFTRKV